jgi:hypothetical protein
MKILCLAAFLFSAPLFAQSFRIFDLQGNDVTGTTYQVPTSTSFVIAPFTVKNTDTVAHDVLACRVVVSVPAGSTNGIVWGTFGYASTVDTAIFALPIAPQQIESFQGEYAGDTTTAPATIGYCFWDENNPADVSCVNVIYNVMTTGVAEAQAASVRSFPNPAVAGAPLTVEWSQLPAGTISVRLVSVTGDAVFAGQCAAAAQRYALPTEGLAGGMYFLEVSAGETLLLRNKIIVE